MSKFAGLGKGAALGTAGAVVVGFTVLALYFGGAFSPVSPPPEPDQSKAALPTPEPAPTAAPESKPVVETAPEVPVLPDPPSIDTFRLDPDGQMLVAGQGAPGWDVSILVDDMSLATLSPDIAGKFVHFLDLPASEKPRILTLSMRSGETGQTLVSIDQIIIAPTPRAVAKAPEVKSDEAGKEVADVTAEPGATAVAESQPDTQSSDPTIEPAKEPAATASQTVLLADQTGVRVLQAPIAAEQNPEAMAEVMSSVALDAITYSDEGEVQLSGRAEGSGFVRIYLDNTPVTTSRVAADGNWASDLPEVDTGVYTLRVDEVSAEGTVVSRVETPFKREDQAVLVAQDGTDSDARARAVTVQPGSTLWAISREIYGEGVMYVRVFEANRDRIRDPDLIYPGQVFALPQ